MTVDELIKWMRQFMWTSAQVAQWVENHFFRTAVHRSTSSGAAHAGMPIVLDSSGKLDNSLYPALFGIGTTTPGTDVVGTVDISRTPILQVDGATPTLIIRGSSNAVIHLIDTGAGSNVKWLRVVSDSGTTTIASLNDDGTANKDTILSIAHSTGIVTFGQGTTFPTGTWLPAITGSGSNPTVTYTTQTGRYTRVGDMVFFSLQIVINTISGGSGNALVSLPITVGTTPGRASVSLSGVDVTTSGTGIALAPSTSSTNAQIQVTVDDAAANSVQVSGLAAGDAITASGFYFV